MTSFPTIKIAMFGTRSTGKTNLLASFCGAEPVQGCFIDWYDTDTRKTLAVNWQRLQHGSVPNATAMTDAKPLTFRLCQKVDDVSTDSLGWNIVFKDYAGKLVEDETDNDAITEEVKIQLDRYFRDADVILFLVPVEIQEWPICEQESYVWYIKTVISIAKRAHEEYGLSTPFCLALMKWDMTGIVVPPAVVSPSGRQTLPPEVSQFLDENTIFQKIHSNIRNLTKEEVAIFAASSYGAHNPNDKKLPDPERLCPFNIIQMLHWMCVNVEMIRYKILQRRLVPLTTGEMNTDKYRDIDRLYQDFLDSGVNTPNLRKQIEQKKEQNHLAYTEFYSAHLQEEFRRIDASKREKNPFVEKAGLLRYKLNEKLYLPEEERELRHDLKEMEGKARERTRKLYVQKVCRITIFSILVVLSLFAAGMGYWIFQNMASYTNGEAILAKENPTLDDFRRAKGCFEVWQIPFENYIPGLQGRRAAFEKQYQKFFGDICSKVDEEVQNIEIPEEFLARAEAYGDRIDVIQRANKSGQMPADIFKAKYEKQIADFLKEQTYWKKVHELAVVHQNIQGAALDKVLGEITKAKSISRKDFRADERTMFTEIDQIKKDSLAEIHNNMNEELPLRGVEGESEVARLIENARARQDIYRKYAKYYPEDPEFTDRQKEIQDKVDQEERYVLEMLKQCLEQELAQLPVPETFQQKSDDAQKKNELYLRYAGYYPPEDPAAADLTQKADEWQQKVDDLEKYVAMEAEANQLEALSGVILLKKGAEFLELYTEADYPDAISLISKVEQFLSNHRNEIEQNLNEKLAELTSPESFQEKLDDAKNRVKIYTDISKEYPSDDSRQAELLDEANDWQQKADDLEKYANLEKLQKEVLANEGSYLLEKGQRFLDDNPEDEYPAAVALFTEVRSAINTVHETNFEKFKEKRDLSPDNNEDSLADRESNLKKRQTLYEESNGNKDLSESDKKTIEGWKADDDALSTRITEWKKLESSYMDAKVKYNSVGLTRKEKLDSCSDYLSKTNTDEFRSYSKYEAWKEEVTRWQGILNREVAIETWISKSEETLKDCRENSEMLEGNLQKLLSSQTEFGSLVTTDIHDDIRTKMNACKTDLDNLIQENKDENMYHNVSKSYDNFKTDPTPETLQNALTEVNTYLGNESYQKYTQTVQTWKDKLVSLQTPRAMDVTLTGYNGVGGTEFDDWGAQVLTLVFDFGGNCTCKMERAVPDDLSNWEEKRSVQAACNTNSLKVTLIKTKSPDIRKTVTINLLKHIVDREGDKFTVSIPAKDGKTIKGYFTISNLPQF